MNDWVVVHGDDNSLVVGVVHGNNLVVDVVGGDDDGLVVGRNDVRDGFMDESGMGVRHTVDRGVVLDDSLVVSGSSFRMSGCGALVMFDVLDDVVSAMATVRVMSLRVVTSAVLATMVGLAVVGGVVVGRGVVVRIVVRG
ncbi:MAG: hypothetical protein GY849_17520 [Deltaproteobacteria bacterium]|nr:hypothetical protein [Deltaproteobacteria bacterium]